ncbi:MAG: tetratricopeptide repeat protein [Solirubrobacteraceae bacterium]|nr:tetratricopeptide repeat protein [Solirubrobacteraceae bacterium]
MTGFLRRVDPGPLIRSAPIALPQILALLAIIVLSAPEGGYPLEQWGPAAVLTELLLVVALITLPRRARPPLSRLAIAGIAGYAIWSGVSIAWSLDQGAAATATTRTAMLAATFALFARWRHTPRSALTVLAITTIGLGIVTWGTVFNLLGVKDIDPWFFYDRLLEPVGYVNAGAAFWGIAAFLGVGLVGGNVAPPLRIAGAAVAVPAAALSFLCLSRGGLLADAAVVVLILALLPGRARNATALAVVGLPLLLAVPSLLDVGDAARLDPNAAATVHRAMGWTIGATLLAMFFAAGWALIEHRVPAPDPRRDRVARAGGIALAVVGAIVALAFLANVGPVTRDRAADAIDSIKSTSYQPVGAGENRLTAGLSSGRWQFWSVGWDQFVREPLHGVGADNFRQDFLLIGKGGENPAYPHSIEIRTLGQLGLVGAVLLLAWIVPVLIAVRRLAAGRDPAGRAVAVAAGGAFALWLIHGSVDWLLEYAGMSAIVAAVAGLVVSSAPDLPSRSRAVPREGALFGSLVRWPAIAVLLLAVTWTSAQWASERTRAAAVSIAPDQPQRAIEKAEQARSLDPFSDDPDRLIGQLAIQTGDYAKARSAYLDAFQRNRGALTPRIWLGVIASAQGNRKEARTWLKRAIRVAPRDGLSKALLDRVTAFEQLDPKLVLNELLERRRALVNDPDPAPNTSG